MSWWDDDTEVLGDGPADRITEAWRIILGARAQGHSPLPTLFETLEAYAHVLDTAHLKPASRGIALKKSGVVVRLFQGSSKAPPDLVEAFSKATHEIAGQYRDRFGRVPTTAELVKTLEFVVGYKPERFFSDATQWPLDDYRLRTA